MSGRVDTVDRYQREHPWAGFSLAVVYKFVDDQGGYLAALIAYYGFLSLFPLLLLLVTIVGFALHGDHAAQQRITSSALAQFPLINVQLGTAGAILGGNLDAKVSSRSVYAGGPVASVTAPVAVGSNTDKTGYILASSGFDAIQVESGVNVRQALSPILAASAGVLLGAGTGTVVIKGGNVAVTRILASTDNAGNRTAVTLALPA